MDERERLILRQVALKASAAYHTPETSTLSAVLDDAEAMLDWLLLERTVERETTPASQPQPQAGPYCPKCKGDMWDNRRSKRNPRAPDYRCKNKECDGVIWPPKEPAA